MIKIIVKQNKKNKIKEIHYFNKEKIISITKYKEERTDFIYGEYKKVSFEFVNIINDKDKNYTIKADSNEGEYIIIEGV